MNSRNILNLGEFEIKNNVYHFICKEILSKGISNSVFLVQDINSNENIVYDWDSLSHRIWELIDQEEINESDIRQINVVIELKLEN